MTDHSEREPLNEWDALVKTWSVEEAVRAYLRLVDDWSKVCDAFGVAGDSSAQEVIDAARDAARQPAEVVEVEGKDGVIHRVWRDAARQPAEETE